MVNAKIVPFVLVTLVLFAGIGVALGVEVPGTVEIPNPFVGGGDGEQVRCDLETRVEFEGADLGQEPEIKPITFEKTVSRSGLFSGSVGSSASLLSLFSQDQVRFTYVLSSPELENDLTETLNVGELGFNEVRTAAFSASKLPEGSYTLKHVLTWDNSEPLDLSSGEDVYTTSFEVTC